MSGRPFEVSSAPYPGLRPFRIEESDIFFGREAQTDQLLDRLARYRFVAVTGPSGCGKSSLVRAGVIPALNSGFMVSAGSRWRIASMRPGERPIARLAAAVATQEVLGAYRSSPEGLPFVEAALRRGPLGLVETLRTSTALEGANLLVLVDQFEELFRFREKANPEEADAFVSLLLASVSAPEVPVYVVITMRSDYLGDCALFHGLPEAVSDAQYLTPRLTRQQLASAIEGPARVFGGRVEPLLVNRLLNDFGSNPDRLPLLQHALMRMWDLHVTPGVDDARGTLTVDDYKKIGELRALSDHADEVLRDIETERGRQIVQVMFRRLTERGKGRKDVRAPATVKDVRDVAGATLAEATEVIEVFRRGDRNFVVASDEAITDRTVLDIGHEALIERWKGLAAWVAAEAESAATYRRLVETGHLNKQGRARHWEDPELGFAMRWKQVEAPSAAWATRYGSVEDYQVAMAFLEDSETRHKESLAEADHRRRAQLLRARVVAAISFLAALGLAVGILLHLRWHVWEHAAYYRSFSKVWGEPRGVGELTVEQVRHRQWSVELLKKGTRGRLVRMRAVDRRLQATSNHAIGTYLEYAMNQPGMLRPVRWEFGYDNRDRVAHETAYDGRGRHIWTFAYTPLKEGSASTRTGSFFGPDGLPLRSPGPHQRKDPAPYAAAFILIDYAPDGHEKRVRYRTRAGKPVAGMDRAYGQEFSYGDAGALAEVTSLGPDNEPIIDVYGNATLRVRSDPHGDEIEAAAYDTNGKSVIVSDGWARRTYQRDRDGRIIEAAYFDESAKPVMQGDGYHRAVFRYDDASGGLAEERYWDAAGGPAFPSSAGCHGYRHRVDTRGDDEEATCLGADGQPSMNRNGYASAIRRYDDWHNIVEEAFRDTAGKPVLSNEGYSRSVRGYDQDGNLTVFERYGVDDTPIAGDKGYWKSQSAFDARGNLIRTSYFATDGRPFVTEDGYSSFEQEYDSEGNLILVRSLGPDGKPALDRDGVAGWTARYDALGQRIEFVDLGLDGAPALERGGYAGRRTEYEGSGDVRQVTYTGVAGETAVTNEGISGWRSSHDEMGNETSRTYLGPDGRPTRHRDGYSSWRKSYDRRGNEVRCTYLGIDGHPAVLRPNEAGGDEYSGYSTVERVYDEHNRAVEERYAGVYGQPVLVGPGFARAVHRYNFRGANIETAYFGVLGEPTAVRQSYHRVQRLYDGLGRNMEVRYFSAEGKPIECADGYARLVRGYDRYGRMVEEAVFARNGAPTSGPDGSHRNHYEYDEQGRRTATRHFGTDDRPILLPAGYHALRSIFNTFGDPVQEDYLGLEGQLLLNRETGYARSRSRYDALKRLTELALFGPDDRPIRGKEGFSRLTFKYDVRGHVIDARAFGPDAGPTTLPAGYSRIQKEYTLQGQVLRESYFSPDGRAALRPQTADGGGGYASVRYKYDAYGDKVEEAYFGLDGRPILLSGNYHRIAYKFNPVHELVETATYDVAGKLAFNRDKYARFTHKYDSQGRLLEVATYDAKGQLSVANVGYARMVLGWDSRGNQTSERYYNAHGALVTIDSGVAGWDRKYDGLGCNVEEVFIGVDGRACDGDEGYARIVRRCDEGRRKTSEKFFHDDGRPARILGVGQHATLFIHDGRGNVVAERYLDERGRPTRGFNRDADLCAYWTAVYGSGHEPIKSTCH